MIEKDSNIVQSSIYSQMGKALKEIEIHYVKNTQAYVEELGNYSLEIKKLTTQLETCTTEEEKNVTLLRPIEDEIYYHQRQLYKLNEVFAQKVLHFETLDESYVDGLDSQTQNTIHKKQKKELSCLLEEIEVYEATLLEEELQRLNLLSVLEPLQHKIVQLETQRKECMNQKEHYEMTKLSQITMLSTPFEEEKELVDIDVIEENIE